jgi:hypothetical protein
MNIREIYESILRSFRNIEARSSPTKQYIIDLVNNECYILKFDNEQTPGGCLKAIRYNSLALEYVRE